MYQYILNMWIMRKFDQTKVQVCVTKGFITQEQADMILATSQAEVV